MKDDAFGAAPEFPPFPGAAGGDEEDERDEGEGDEGIEAPDGSLIERRIGTRPRKAVILRE